MAFPTIGYVLEQFGSEPSGWRELGAAGGFSGARFWKGMAFDQTHCLRRWPREHPSKSRLQFIHEVLTTAQANGFRRMPLPRQLASSLDAFLEHDGVLWQLEPWIEGEADFHRDPSRVKACNALTALGQFHRSIGPWRKQTGRPPVVQDRIDRLTHLSQSTTFLTAAPVDPAPDLDFARQALTEYADLAAPLIEPARNALSQFAASTVELRPTIRDIWSDHVLFSADEVTGLIDFGAMRLDWQLADVARLLGSLDEGTGRFWDAGLKSYCESADRDVESTAPVISALDTAIVLMAPFNWLNWLLFERRRFESMPRVRQRLLVAMTRLRRLAGHGGIVQP